MIDYEILKPTYCQLLHFNLRQFVQIHVFLLCVTNKFCYFYPWQTEFWVFSCDTDKFCNIFPQPKHADKLSGQNGYFIAILRWNFPLPFAIFWQLAFYFCSPFVIFLDANCFVVFWLFLGEGAKFKFIL